MKYVLKSIIVVFFLMISFTASIHAQTIPIPQIDSISVMDDNRVCVGWSMPTYPNISRFVIYRKRITDFAFIPIDSVNASLPRVWYDDGVDPRTERWYYAIAAMSSDDIISGLSPQHSYPVLSVGEYSLCDANQGCLWLDYIGEVVQYYELISYHNGILYDRSISNVNSSSVRVVPGRMNHIRVRAHFNNATASSPLIEIVPDSIQISKQVAITRIQRFRDFFDVWAKNIHLAHRSHVTVFFNDGASTQNYRETSTESSIRFRIPVGVNVGTFTCSVTDVCGHEYSNDTPIQSIWLEIINRPNNVLLQWNCPHGFENLTYSIIYNDGEDRLAANLTDESYYFFEFTQNTYSVPELCFRIEAFNDTLSIISNTQCLNIEEDLLWPNAFIPDGDGFDEFFRPVIRRFYPETYDLEIFDNKGQLLFKTSDTEQGWSGYFNGKLVPLGAYIWRATYKISGKEFKKHGLVNVIY
ncbi:MAG TPA: gliding motility-associated C-terminal domain-containing protein [Salinivirgaceae bacterium]|nr:gliding motility-associated C-terminal domain-containing protein [Salinivirgaceae bacterium]